MLAELEQLRGSGKRTKLVDLVLSIVPAADRYLVYLVNGARGGAYP